MTEHRSKEKKLFKFPWKIASILSLFGGSVHVCVYVCVGFPHRLCFSRTSKRHIGSWIDLAKMPLGENSMSDICVHVAM